MCHWCRSEKWPCHDAGARGAAQSPGAAGGTSANAAAVAATALPVTRCLPPVTCNLITVRGCISLAPVCPSTVLKLWCCPGRIHRQGMRRRSCVQLCGRKLRCGNHLCPSPCHAGPCQPCPLSATIACACGRTTFSTPCGTESSAKPPKCSEVRSHSRLLWRICPPATSMPLSEVCCQKCQLEPAGIFVIAHVCAGLSCPPDLHACQGCPPSPVPLWTMPQLHEAMRHIAGRRLLPLVCSVPSSMLVVLNLRAEPIISA